MKERGSKQRVGREKGRQQKWKGEEVNQEKEAWWRGRGTGRREPSGG